MVGPNGTVSAMIYGRAWSAKLCGPPISLLLLSSSFGEESCPKGNFLKLLKIENGIKINQGGQNRHRDPLKTFSGRVQNHYSLKGPKLENH